MSQSHADITAFPYQAQNIEGKPISGTIDAPSRDDAMRSLESLGVRVLDLAMTPVASIAWRPGAIRSQDFVAFNQQLGQLAHAGLPIEQGLRLIAQDMGSRRLADTVRRIADELDRGVPLGQAFDTQRGKFPLLYGRLIDAGVKTNNLPGMLLNLGTHVEMVQRLRAMVWRSAAYPLMVLAALIFVMVFIGMYIIPQFEQIFVDFGTELPAITKLALAGARHLPEILTGAGAIVGALIGVCLLFRISGRQAWLIDHVMLRVPVIGPVLKRNRVARWCDAVRLGVEAGLDLPAAVELAGAAVASPRLEHDGARIIQALQSGQSLDAVAGRTRILPATIPAAMSLAVHGGGRLADMLATLSSLYQQQAETRISLVPAILSPLLLITIGVLVGLVIIAMFAPMLSLISAVSGV